MKHKVIFIVFFIFYLIVCYFHFRWEKYFETYFGDAYDPYTLSTLETPAQNENAMNYFNLALKSSVTRKKIEYLTKALEMDPRLAIAYEKRGCSIIFKRNMRSRFRITRHIST